VRRALGLLVLVLACVLLGCGGERSVPITTWTFEAPGRAERMPVELPAQMSGLPAEPCTYFLRTAFPVPTDLRGKALTLALPGAAARITAQANGVDLVDVDVNTLDRYRSTGPHRWRVPADLTKQPELAFVLRVEHTWSPSGWFYAAPTLSDTRAGEASVVAAHAFNTASTVGAIATGLFVVLLYGFFFVSLRDKRRYTYGLFALGGLSGIFYPAWVLGLTQPLLGTFDTAVMAVMLTVAAVAAIHFSHAYFGLKRPHRAWLGLVVVTVVAAVFARNPFRSMHVLGPLLFIATVSNAAVQLVLCVRLRRQEPRPRNLYLIALAWPATAILAVPDFLAWLGYADPLWGLRTAGAGISLISIMQATALSREHLISLRRADELNAELAARVDLLQAKHREVELLNDELRRQIAARSRALAERLATEEATAGEEINLQPGQIIEDRYEIVRLIGAGGMGSVYEVKRLVDGKHFALKALIGVSDPFARARFAREAQIAAQVNHPNVVSIVDVDQAKSGFLFLVMELLEGTTLHEVRRRQKDIPWSLFVLTHVAEGLHAIHEKGIVHRDLKPGNVLLSRGSDGRRPLVKITDFGISSLVAEARSSRMMRAAQPSSPAYLEDHDTSQPPSAAPPRVVTAPLVPADEQPTIRDELPPAGVEVDESKTTIRREPSGKGPPPPATPSDPLGRGRTPAPPLTETGVIFGTPNYMAAELTAGTKNARPSADVFSLGVIAFELLTHRRPFFLSPVQAAMDGKPLPVAPSFREAVPMLRPDIAALLDRAMSHDPHVRPTARELADALAAAYQAVA
jgi:serine/threonine protein kinase